jgi:hypothetical protein
MTRRIARALVAALALGAQTAAADESAVAAATRVDLYTSATQVSPAQLHRYSSPQAAVSLGLGRTAATASWADQPSFGDGSASDDARFETQELSYVTRVTPSLAIAASVRRFHERGTGDDDLIGVTNDYERNALQLGPAAAFKIMDRLVLGLDLRIRRTSFSGDGAPPKQFGHFASSQGVLLKEGLWELGWAQDLWSYKQRSEGEDKTQHFFRSSVVHVRRLLGASGALSLLARRNPLAPCCYAADGDRWTASLVADGTVADVRLEGGLEVTPERKADARGDQGYDPERRAALASATAPIWSAGAEGRVWVGAFVRKEWGGRKDAPVERAGGTSAVDTADVSTQATHGGVTFTYVAAP